MGDDLRLAPAPRLDVRPLTMQTAAATTAVESIAPQANARWWGIASSILSSLAVAVMASPLPWPWGLVAGSILGTGSAAAAMMAARRFDGRALGELVATVAAAVEAHHSKAPDVTPPRR